MTSWVHPGLIMILGSILIPFLKGNVKKAYLLLLPALAFISVLTMQEGVYWNYDFLGQAIVIGRVDKLALLFAYIFTIGSFAFMLYGLKEDNPWHNVATMVYPGAALGSVFAGDLLTLLFFWEAMAFSSVFLILFGGTERAYKAAYRYILVHAVSGICLMAGIIIHVHNTGSFAFNPMGGSELNLATGLMLGAFLLNAAVPPFSAWLPDAYPEASVTGAIFLSAFTTKTAIYALARGFAGVEILIYLGAIIAFYAIVYAVLENNIRKLLSHHIISQVGFMVCAIGIGTSLALNGAVVHALANIVYKGLLFMGAGAILYMTGKRKLTEIGGLYKTMPWTCLLFMIGAFSIAATPLTLGFVSKSIILSAAAHEHMTFAWVVMTLASTGTFLSITMKIGYFAFFGKDAGLEAKDPPLNMLLGMGILAFLCLFWGFFPGHLYGLLPYDMHYEPYTLDHVIWVAELLLFTCIAFFGFIKVAAPKDYLALDTDWFYRRAGRLFMCFAYRVVLVIDEAVSNAYNTVLLKWTKLTAEESYTIDKSIVDGAVNGVAKTVLRSGKSLRRIQTGQLQHYGVAILIGVVILLNVLIFFR